MCITSKNIIFSKKTFLVCTQYFDPHTLCTSPYWFCTQKKIPFDPETTLHIHPCFVPYTPETCILWSDRPYYIVITDILWSERPYHIVITFYGVRGGPVVLSSQTFYGVRGPVILLSQTFYGVTGPVILSSHTLYGVKCPVILSSQTTT